MAKKFKTKNESEMKTIILSGGIGSRLKEETEFKPKPMIEIGSQPIIWHIMSMYRRYGYKDFIIAAGYKIDVFRDWLIRRTHFPPQDDFNIQIVDTGLETLTGERVKMCGEYVGRGPFMVTYGDGLSNINLQSVQYSHENSGKLATVSTFYPMLKYGGFTLKPLSFQKKAQLEQPINGGFMVFENKVLDTIGDGSMIEDIFPSLIDQKQLNIYEHKGYFQSMDTYADMEALNNIFMGNTTSPPWMVDPQYEETD